MGLVDFSLGDVGGAIRSVREVITGEKITDPLEMAKVGVTLQTLENALTTGQLGINRVEAVHPSIFIAGWRPAVGWICVAALGYQYVMYPFLLWAWAAWGPEVEPPPVMDTGALMTLLLGMLGIGGLRTLEKFKQVDTKRHS